MDHEHKRFVLEGGCPARGTENILVTVPVAIRGFCHVEKVELSCMGPAVVTRNCDYTPGEPGKISRFTISQKMRIEVPCIFGAESVVGEAYTETGVSGRGFGRGQDGDDDDCDTDDDCDAGVGFDFGQNDDDDDGDNDEQDSFNAFRRFSR